MPPPIMQSIIRQNGHPPPTLPDFRNLGTVLRVLWLASPRLARLPYATGAGLVMLVAILAGIVVHETRRVMDPGPGGAMLASWLIWGVVATGLLLMYFHLRARALSPAIAEA